MNEINKMLLVVGKKVTRFLEFLFLEGSRKVFVGFVDVQVLMTKIR